MDFFWATLSINVLKTIYIYSEFTLNCVEPRKGPCVKTFYESSSI